LDKTRGKKDKINWRDAIYRTLIYLGAIGICLQVP